MPQPREGLAGDLHSDARAGGQAAPRPSLSLARAFNSSKAEQAPCVSTSLKACGQRQQGR